jgi:hypothetical protein
MNRTEIKTRLREMAQQVIGTAAQMLDAVACGIEPIGIADPEPWTIKRAYARRMLNAIDSGGRVDPKWLDAIGRAAAGHGSWATRSPVSASA